MVVEVGNVGKNSVFKRDLTVYMNSGAPYFGPGTHGGTHTIDGNYTFISKEGLERLI